MNKTMLNSSRRFPIVNDLRTIIKKFYRLHSFCNQLYKFRNRIYNLTFIDK